MNLLFNVMALAIGLLFPIVNYLGFEWYYPRPTYDVEAYAIFHFYGILAVSILALFFGSFLVIRKINFIGVGLILGAVLSLIFDFLFYAYHLSHGVRFGAAIISFILLIVLGLYFVRRRAL